MPDFATALNRIHARSGAILAEATVMLRQLVEDTCAALSAAEGSILVPVEGKNQLRFLVSLNPSLENSEVFVPIDGSISGYVFTTRQAMAKIKPESEGAAMVDQLSRITTSYLLAVPIVDDDRVYGVATFVNRREPLTDTPFSVDDLRRAQAYGEVYASAMKLHRKVEFCTRIARIEISEHAREFGVDTVPEPTEVESSALRHRIPALLAERAADLPERERDLLFRIGELIREHSATSGQDVAHDL